MLGLKKLGRKVESAVNGGPHITRKELREYRAEQRRLEFVEVRKRGGGEQEKARRRRQMGQRY